MKKAAHSLALFIFVIFVSLFPFPASAAQSGGYVGVFGGYTLDLDASWQFDDFSYALDVRDTETFGFKLGFAPPPVEIFSCEFEYSYLNPDEEWTLLATAGDDFSAVDGDVKLHNFMFNVFARYPSGKLKPYCGMGLGTSYFDFSAISTARIDNVDYSERSSGDDFVFAWQILIGADLDLTDTLSLDIGYRYFDTESFDDDYDYHHHHYDYYHGSTIEYNTSMVTLGLKYRFGATD